MSELYIVSGHLAADPETHFFTDGAQVTNFRIGVDDSYSRQDGTRVKRTKWMRVTARRKLGEVCAKFLSKGREVTVHGKIKMEYKEGVDGSLSTNDVRTFERQDGSAGAAIEIEASYVKFHGGRSDSGPAVGAPQDDGGSDKELDDESIPF